MSGLYSSSSGRNSQIRPNDDSTREIVLRSSRQCLPIVCFGKDVLKSSARKECVNFIQQSLQQIFDRLFNKGLEQADIKNLPSASASPPPVPWPWLSGMGMMGGAGSLSNRPAFPAPSHWGFNQSSLGQGIGWCRLLPQWLR